MVEDHCIRGDVEIVVAVVLGEDHAGGRATGFPKEGPGVPGDSLTRSVGLPPGTLGVRPQEKVENTRPLRTTKATGTW